MILQSLKAPLQLQFMVLHSLRSLTVYARSQFTLSLTVYASCQFTLPHSLSAPIVYAPSQFMLTHSLRSLTV